MYVIYYENKNDKGWCVQKNEIKGDKSFSDIIEELIEESLSLRKRKLKKYFGILSEEGLKNWREKLKKWERRMMKVLIESSAIIDYLKGNKK